MARGRRRGSPLWLFSVVAAVAVLALLVANAPRHSSSVAVQPPGTTTEATVTTVPADTVVTHTKKRTTKPAATVAPTTPATDLLTGEAVTPDTAAPAPTPTPTTTPKTVAPILAPPKPLVAHLAVTG